MSYGDGVFMTCLTDTAIMSKPYDLMEKLEKYLDRMLEEGKEAKKDK
jgi:hypothetical protein